MFLFLSLVSLARCALRQGCRKPASALAARRRRWDHCHGHGTKKPKKGAPLCVRKNRTSARPGRLPFPTDNFEKEKKKIRFSPGELVGVEGNPRDSNSTQRDPEKQHRIAPHAAEAPLRCQ